MVNLSGVELHCSPPLCQSLQQGQDGVVISPSSLLFVTQQGRVGTTKESLDALGKGKKEWGNPTSSVHKKHPGLTFPPGAHSLGGETKRSVTASLQTVESYPRKKGRRCYWDRKLGNPSDA
jgi:hypothetical protein